MKKIKTNINDNSLLFIVIVITVFLTYVDTFVPINYYFEATLSENKILFPTFYLATFFILKLIFPLLYGVWVYRYLNYFTQLKKLHLIIFLLFQSFLWILCLHIKGFTYASKYTFLLILAPVIISILQSISRFMLNYYHQSLITKYVFYITYIIISISIGYIHPFNRFSMFNKFSNTAFVIMLRGDDNQIIPISNYCDISENGLFEIYNAIRNMNDYKNDNNSDQNKIIGREMFKCMKLKIKQPLDINSDSLSIYKIAYLVKDGKIVVSEKKIYTQQIE